MEEEVMSLEAWANDNWWDLCFLVNNEHPQKPPRASARSTQWGAWSSSRRCSEYTCWQPGCYTMSLNSVSVSVVFLLNKSLPTWTWKHKTPRKQYVIVCLFGKYKTLHSIGSFSLRDISERLQLMLHGAHHFAQLLRPSNGIFIG